MPGPGWARAPSAVTTPPAGPTREATSRPGERDPRQRPPAGQQSQHREADTEHQREPGEHPRGQGETFAGSPLSPSDQHVPSLCAAGVRQGEGTAAARRHRSPSPMPVRRGRFRARAALGGLDVALKPRIRRCSDGHRPHPVESAATGAPTPGMPSPTPCGDAAPPHGHRRTGAPMSVTAESAIR